MQTPHPRDLNEGSRALGKRMSRRRIVALIVTGVLGLIVASMFVITERLTHSPLGVGATADEAWTYLHTSSAIHKLVKIGPLLWRKDVNWHADVHQIQIETEFYFQKDRLFGTRELNWTLDTNGTITSANSRWTWTWPFKKAPAAPAGAWPSNAVFLSTLFSSNGIVVSRSFGTNLPAPLTGLPLVGMHYNLQKVPNGMNSFPAPTTSNESYNASETKP